MTKVHIWPHFDKPDDGDGGVRRVIEAQRCHLPDCGVEVVTTADQADVIACHISAPQPYFNNHPGKPFVAHNHGLYWAEYDWGAGWYRKANADCMELIRRADVTTAPSEWVAQAIRRHTMRPVVPIRHGVELDEWRVIEDHGGYVLWNKTRPDPICDPDPAMQLAAAMPDLKFVSTFGRADLPNVVLTGPLPYQEARELVRRAGVYLCTTRETFGIGTIEAMAAGVPVVGWAWGGQREIIEHGRTGWLVPPGDFEGLAEGVRWALENRREAGGAAREAVAARYRWADVVQDYARLYEAVVGSCAARRPKVSVIVTAYDLARYLPDCLASVAAQTLEDWELVIVDDASPDESGEIAEQFAKDHGGPQRITVAHNEANQYLAGARNTGIEVASGRYVLPLDADDMLAPRALEELANALDRDRSIHIAYGAVHFVEEDGHKPSTYQGYEEDPGHSGWPMAFRHDWQLMGRNLLPYCSMFRREVWAATGGYRIRCRTAEDADFWTRASSYGFRPAMVTQADTLIYRNRPESMSREQSVVDWVGWFPWSGQPELTPAGAAIGEQLPVPSLEPAGVAVIIPVGPGHEKLVMDAVDSVDAQTYRNWGCVVVNDTGRPLGVRLPSWVRVVDMEGGPRGVAAARNAGIRASSVPLFLPLDADDYLQPHALEVLEQIQREVGGYVYPDWWDESAGATKRYEAPEYDARLLISKGCFHAVTALYPRDAWERVGGFDETLPAWEDWDFALKLADVGICGTRAPDPLFVYRKEAGRRREQNFADFEDSKQAIKSKWRLWDGKGGKELMGCSGCPGGGGATVRPTPQIRASAAGPLRRNGDERWALIEYVGDSAGGRTYRGRVTGMMYRFAGTPNDRLKYVLAQDLEIFTGRRDFQIREMPAELPVPVGEQPHEPLLTAPGPPLR